MFSAKDTRNENKICITSADDLSSTADYDCESDESIQQDVPVLQLLMKIEDIDENIIFLQKGYEKIRKICDTLQGELFKAMTQNAETNETVYVAIKKTKKLLLRNKIAIEGNNNFCVSENIIKEALILRHITIENTPIGEYIVKYVDFFESNTDYYLVTEYIPSEMNLKQFVCKSNEYIQNGQLSLKHYQKMMKYLLFQLFVTIQWLHNSIHCCVLDVCMENVMLSDAEFIEDDKNGKIAINPHISIKLSDFGVAEIFDDEKSDKTTKNINCFLCNKQGLSLENEGWFAPKVFNGDIYDARCADNWCLGIILYECMTVGKHLYEPIHRYKANSGYYAICIDMLKPYLMINDTRKYFSKDGFSLLNSLLNVNEKQRIKGIHILRHKWFKMYYARYKKQIEKKFSSNRQHVIDINAGYRKRFPFYNSDYDI